MFEPCYTGGFAALPRPSPGPSELAALTATPVGAVALRRLARAAGRSSPLARRLGVTTLSPGVATLAVTTTSRFGCRLGLRPSVAVAFGAAVTALVGVSVGGWPTR